MPGELCYHPGEYRGGIPLYLEGGIANSELPLDYGWTHDGETHLVEHKTVADCAQSLQSGHLRSQLERGKAVTPHVWLVLTGMPVDIDGHLGSLSDCEEEVRGTWTYKRFWQALLALLYGLQVGGPLITLSRKDTAWLLGELHHRTAQERIGTPRPVLPKWQSLLKRDTAEMYVRGLGIGWKHAETLAAAYPTWHLLIAATPEDIRKLSGFGTVLAGKVWGLLR